LLNIGVSRASRGRDRQPDARRVGQTQENVLRKQVQHRAPKKIGSSEEARPAPRPVIK